MFSWLVRGSQNSRVYMCIKEVKWELGRADQVYRAMILALAQCLRIKMIEAEDIPLHVLDRPLDYSRRDLMFFFDTFGDIRMRSDQEVKITQKNYRRIGLDLPKFAVDHANAVSRGLQVWICTLGAGIAPNRQDYVREI